MTDHMKEADDLLTEVDRAGGMRGNGNVEKLTASAVASALVGIGYELRRIADATEAQLTGTQRQILKQGREQPTPVRPDSGDTW